MAWAIHCVCEYEISNTTFQAFFFLLYGRYSSYEIIEYKFRSATDLALWSQSLGDTEVIQQ